MRIVAQNRRTAFGFASVHRPVVVVNGRDKGQEAASGQFQCGWPDRWQALVYMLFLPQTHENVNDRVLRGSVVYPGNVRVEIPPSAADKPTRDRVVALIRKLSDADPPDYTPSASECRFCDIAACNFRVSDDDAAVETEEF